ncbi:thioredoxin domain-containing protein [Streptomyces sp. NPDC057694]|uniref:thioredoxin domain-containing protein n=1 Tax=unclassified Streptomyces TaxID=2593676 RepID=UPI0036862224
MSKRNSQQAKTAARERLRIEREKQAKKAKAKRQAIVIGSIVGVLAIAGGIGYFAVQAMKPSHWETAMDAKTADVVAPAHTTGTNGTTVVIGKDSAKKTLKLYEDSRCPVCASFEQTVGSTVHKDVEDGKFKIQYIGATFIDGDGSGKIGSNGEGSKNALSALGAALNVSQDAFLDYKTALYSKKYHPDETKDEFKSDDYLIKVANTVDALKNNKAFQKDVRNGTYDNWAMKMSKTFDSNKDEVTGTPSLVMDGKKLVGSDGQNAPMTVADFNTAIEKALAG